MVRKSGKGGGGEGGLGALVLWFVKLVGFVSAWGVRVSGGCGYKAERVRRRGPKRRSDLHCTAVPGTRNGILGEYKVDNVQGKAPAVRHPISAQAISCRY